MEILENFLEKWVGVFRKCPPIKPKKVPSPSLRDLWVRMILISVSIRVCGLGKLASRSASIVTHCYTFALAFSWDYAIVHLWRDGATMLIGDTKMDELKNLLLAQHRFNLDPSAANWQQLEQCMYAYQNARYGDHSK